MTQAAALRGAAKLAVAVAMVLAAGWPAPLRAQAVPTQEGTVIRNKATATFKDVANNSYDAESNEVEVTVGFKAGVDVTAPTDIDVNAGSADNTLQFRMCMVGNAADATRDWFVVSIGNSNPALITNVRYQWNATTYTSLGDLNAALAAAKTTAYDDPATPAEEENCIDVTVLFDAGEGAAGSSSNFTMTATSGRDSNTSDSDTAAATLRLTGAISVTPDDGLQDVYRGASATYNTLVFTLTNNQNGEDDFTLLATLDAGAAGYAISSIRCLPADAASGAETSCMGVPAGGTRTIHVVLEVPGTAVNGSQASVTLTATSQARSTVSDTGEYVTTVIMPILTMTKAAYGAKDTNESVGAPKPGDPIWYLITISNTGTAAGSNVVVTDALPAEVTYVSSEAATGTWTSITESGGTVTASLSGSLALNGSASFWIRVVVK
jgi:uncharacterized repeat protein (TIGR01451 family)